MQLISSLIPVGILALSSLASGCLHKRQSGPEGNSNGTNQYAPVPEAAAAIPIDRAIGYAVQDLSGGAYAITDGTYQSFFLISDEGVIVVDVPPSIGNRLKYAVGNLTDAPIKKIVYSHAHADHISGAFLFAGPDVEIIAQEETALLLSEVKNDTQRPMPQRTFSDNCTVTLGNQTLELEYKGDNHLAGNIYIHAPAQQIVMLVDVIFPQWVTFAGLGLPAYVPQYVRSIDQILAYNFTYFLGGHLSRPGTRQDVEDQKEYVDDLRVACTKTLEAGLGIPPLLNALTVNPGNIWAGAEALYDSMAQACYDEVTPKWITRLGGADTFGFENAMRMVQGLRIDYGILGPGGVFTG